LRELHLSADLASCDGTQRPRPHAQARLRPYNAVAASLSEERPGSRRDQVVDLRVMTGESPDQALRALLTKSGVAAPRAPWSLCIVAVSAALQRLPRTAGLAQPRPWCAANITRACGTSPVDKAAANILLHFGDGDPTGN
jgi:hypothetical protein